MRKKKIFYVYRTSRQSMYNSWLQRKDPDHFLYGLNYFKKWGYQVSFSDQAFKQTNLLRWLFSPLHVFINMLTAVNFRLDQALLLLPRLQTSDVIITTGDGVGLPILLLKRIKLLATPVIYISIGLISEMNIRRKSVSFLFFRWLLSLADIIVCNTYLEYNLFLRLTPEIIKKIQVVPFGIDVDYFKCPKKRGKFILSIGRDKSRDYKLLAKAAKKLPKQQFILVTSPANVARIELPLNVKVYFDLPYERVRTLYCQAKLVFLPIKAWQRPSGQVTFLEALATKNIIVVSKKEGITPDYDQLIDNARHNILLFEARNLSEATKCITDGLKRNRSRFIWVNKFTSKAYAAKLRTYVDEIST